MTSSDTKSGLGQILQNFKIQEQNLDQILGLPIDSKNLDLSFSNFLTLLKNCNRNVALKILKLYSRNKFFIDSKLSSSENLTTENYELLVKFFNHPPENQPENGLLILELYYSVIFNFIFQNPIFFINLLKSQSVNTILDLLVNDFTGTLKITPLLSKILKMILIFITHNVSKSHKFYTESKILKVSVLEIFVEVNPESLKILFALRI